jgi:hypothetical protein
MSLAERYERLYDESIPPDLGREILRLLAKNFDRVRDFVELHWQGPEAHDLIGVVRRAYIEQDLRAVAGRTPGVTATFEQTGGGRSHYTAISAGRLVITASCTETPQAMPRSAEFRSHNAEALQLNFFRSNVKLADADVVYGILVYSGVGRRLTFAALGFPDRDCDGWLHSVDLRRKYPDTWGEIYPEPAAPVDPEPQFLRRANRA